MAAREVRSHIHINLPTHLPARNACLRLSVTLRARQEIKSTWIAFRDIRKPDLLEIFTADPRPARNVALRRQKSPLKAGVTSLQAGAQDPCFQCDPVFGHYEVLVTVRFLVLRNYRKSCAILAATQRVREFARYLPSRSAAHTTASLIADVESGFRTIRGPRKRVLDKIARWSQLREQRIDPQRSPWPSPLTLAVQAAG